MVPTELGWGQLGQLVEAKGDESWSSGRQAQRTLDSVLQIWRCVASGCLPVPEFWVECEEIPAQQS